MTLGRAQPLVGLFVGGAARRMGGLAKGLLPHPDTGEPLVARLARLASELGFEPILVGRADAYCRALPALPVVEDRPQGVGPLGGLAGLLHAAGDRPAIALACDMPYLKAELLARLAHEPSAASVLAARSVAGLCEPRCARYEARRVATACADALACGVRSFQALFSRLWVEELSLAPHEHADLRDWDTPEDIHAQPPTRRG